MKIKYVIIGLVAIVLLLVPFVQAETYGRVSCNYVGLIHFYVCSDNAYYPTIDTMLAHYAPIPPEEPLYIFVIGATTETYTP